MISMILKWLIYSLLIVFIAWVIPGISVENFWSAMLVCIIIALINIFIRPLVQFISLPVTFLTLGLFSFIINAFLFMLAGWLSPGFEVDGFWSALFGSIILSIFAGIFDRSINNK